MTFVSSLHTFRLELNKLYSFLNSGEISPESFETKILVPRHPEESAEEVVARALLFAINFQEGLSLGKGAIETKEPTCFRKNLQDELDIIIELASTHSISRFKKLHRRYPDAKTAFFFLQTEQIPLFCKELKGSTDNWVKNIPFFLLPFETLQKIAEQLTGNQKWSMTITSEGMYLSVQEKDFFVELGRVDIWEEFQKIV